MAALRYFFSLLMIPISLVIAGLAVLAFMAGSVSPGDSIPIAFLGLVMPAVLIANLLVILYWIIRKSWWISVPILAILLNIGYIRSIFQISFQNSPAPTESTTIRLASYNVGNFRSWTKQSTQIPICMDFRNEKIDIACFQEYGENQNIKADSLSQLLGLPYYAVEHIPGSTSYNSVIFSKFPILKYGHFPFQNTVNDAIWADLSIEGQIIRVINCHLQTTNFNRSRRQLNNPALQNADIEQVQSVFYNIGNELKDNSVIRAQQADMVQQMIDTTSIPVIVCGDFNDPPSTYTYHRIKGQLKDSFRSRGNGYAYTFRGIHKLLRIDFILYSDQFKCLEYKSPNLEWSDHNPVISEFIFATQ